MEVLGSLTPGRAAAASPARHSCACARHLDTGLGPLVSPPDIALLQHCAHPCTKQPHMRLVICSERRIVLLPHLCLLPDRQCTVLQ